MISEHEYNFEFRKLLDAVLNEPEKVTDIVRGNPDVLEETNFSGETVLHWLAVENRLMDVRLLHSLGARVPHFALVHAVQAGHPDMVALLLELGADKQSWNYENVLANPIWGLSKDVRASMRAYLESYK